MRLLYYLIVLLSFYSQSTLAGGWSSGGGELLKNSNNPWFLNNTPQVNYCILIDEVNFGVNSEIIKKQLKRALSFWQHQFCDALLLNLPDFGQIKIASQEFKEENCNKNTDLRFQFGVLNEQQKKYLKNPSQYAAVTVRTEYDEVNLKAKGFVYISPLKGPLSYAPHGIVENAWSKDDGNLLYLTLLHELGHIFGLQHFGSFGQLMSESFVESLLINIKNTNTFSEHRSSDFFSLKTDTGLICPDVPLLSLWQNFFNVEPDNQCFTFKFEHDPRNSLLGSSWMHVYVSPSKDQPMTLAHSIELIMHKFLPEFLSLIWLSDKQKIFTPKDLENNQIGPGILGTSGLSISKKGLLQTDGKTKNRGINVQFYQGKGTVSIDGIIDNELITLL